MRRMKMPDNIQGSNLPDGKINLHSVFQSSEFYFLFQPRYNVIGNIGVVV